MTRGAPWWVILAGAAMACTSAAPHAAGPTPTTLQTAPPLSIESQAPRSSESASPMPAESGTSYTPPQPPHETFAPPSVTPERLLHKPPPVALQAGDTTFDLEAFTYCYWGGCVDGMQPFDLPSAGDAERVEIEFPLKGWQFTASLREVGPDCPRRLNTSLKQIGPTTHILEPVGYARTYDVTLFGRGGGDLFVAFRWSTPHDGPMPVPTAQLGILVDHDGSVDSYGVELLVAGLRETPMSISAEVTVTSAEGRSLTFTPTREHGCMGQGEIVWLGPDRKGQEAARLGSAPFSYEVLLELDGVRHTGTALWPVDEIEGAEPAVDLTFSPPLPGLAKPTS